VSTRGGGRSGGDYESLNLGIKTGDDTANVLMNRSILLRSLSVPEDRLAIPEQTHSDNITRASEPELYPDCDGLVTDTPNLFLTLSIADCCPVFAFDPQRMAVGLAHAGWKGTRNAIASKLVEEFADYFSSNPSDMVFGLGPSIGPCCYRVGEDLLSEFDRSLFRRTGQEHYLDLWEANRRQLVSAGVKPSSIFVSRVCTSCGPEFFFSHRRDLGRTGRMMALIGIR
jgi:hypothetical protein